MGNNKYQDFQDRNWNVSIRIGTTLSVQDVARAVYQRYVLTGKNLGKEDALIDINNYLHAKRDIKKNILISFLDLDKAFDSISRQLLLNKLKELGFNDNA
ncbi:hypothetical protein QTP88_009871 [Uroleucon formosanum]